MNPTHFRYDEADGVATIRLDRPERLNALTFDSYAELRDAFVRLRTMDSVRAVLLTGRDGPRQTTEIVDSFSHLSRFGVMKHLEEEECHPPTEEEKGEKRHHEDFTLWRKGKGKEIKKI